MAWKLGPSLTRIIVLVMRIKGRTPLDFLFDHVHVARQLVSEISRAYLRKGGSFVRAWTACGLNLFLMGVLLLPFFILGKKRTGGEVVICI